MVSQKLVQAMLCKADLWGGEVITVQESVTAQKTTNLTLLNTKCPVQLLPDTLNYKIHFNVLEFNNAGDSYAHLVWMLHNAPYTYLLDYYQQGLPYKQDAELSYSKNTTTIPIDITNTRGSRTWYYKLEYYIEISNLWNLKTGLNGKPRELKNIGNIAKTTIFWLHIDNTRVTHD